MNGTRHGRKGMKHDAKTRGKKALKIRKDNAKKVKNANEKEEDVKQEQRGL
jgi:hypothetical protein